MGNMWEIITAVSAAIQALAVIIAILYASNQLRNTVKDRHATIFFKLYEMFDDPRARAARYHIFNNLPSEPGNLSREDYEAARDCWNLMNALGVIASHNLASRRIIHDLFSRQVIRLWHKLEPHISYYRKERGYFAGYFEELAKTSRDYRERYYGEDQPVFYKPTYPKMPEAEASSISEPHSMKPTAKRRKAK